MREADSDRARPREREGKKWRRLREGRQRWLERERCRTIPSMASPSSFGVNPPFFRLSIKDGSVMPAHNGLNAKAHGRKISKTHNEEDMTDGTLNDVDGINNVALGLAHLLTARVANDLMQQDLLEGKLKEGA